MASIFTCIKPDEAWSFVHHFLGNNLFAIAGSCGMRDKLPDDKVVREMNERIISRSHIELIGSLYVLVRNMNAHGHYDDESKIQEILDMVTDQDVTKAEVRGAIHAKNRELNAFRANPHVEGNSLCL